MSNFRVEMLYSPGVAQHAHANAFDDKDIRKINEKTKVIKKFSNIFVLCGNVSNSLSN